MNIPGSENNSKKINQNESSNPSFYSSQTKKPIIHFGNINPNLLNINCIPNLKIKFFHHIGSMEQFLRIYFIFQQ